MTLRALYFTTLALTISALTCGGCASKEKELQKIAKDWSLLIRASQVIPVYPLTEDLQPGDIFLVQATADLQQYTYTTRGFLPLDNHIDRIDPSGYEDFYASSFGGDTNNEVPLPKRWLSPGTDGAWSSAPTASFPTYSFSVRKGGGLNLAIPVKGVPVALSLLGAAAAQGTVTIADARTYGVDLNSLRRDVEEWEKENRSLLLNYSASEEKTNYIRVVSRVYLTGRVDISVRSTASFSGAASGGVEKPVNLLVADPEKKPEEATLDTYKENVDKLNTMLAEALKKVAVDGAQKALPGGTVKVVSASANSISLAETFERPLVIGYLGFDMAIGPEGLLGPPIPTHAVLEFNVRPEAPAGSLAKLYRNASLQRAYRILVNLPDDPAASAYVEDLDGLARLLPKQYPCSIFGVDGDGTLITQIAEGTDLREEGTKFPKLVEYRDQLFGSIEKLQSTTGAGTEDLEANETALEELESEIRKNQLLLQKALDYAHRL